MADDQTPGPSRKKVPPPPSTVEIPLEEIRQCYAKDLEKACRMFRNASVENEICPYNKNHRVRYDQIDEHVRQCRFAYQVQIDKEGGVALKLSCKWNYEHQIIAPELIFHEERCLDGMDRKVPWYVLSNIGAYFDDDEILAKLDEYDTGPSQEEIDEWYRGRYLNVVVGADNRTGAPIPIDELRSPEKAKERLELEIATAAKERRQSAIAINKRVMSKFNQPDPYAFKPGSLRADDPDDGDGEDDEEDWGKNANAPHFDYMQHSLNPTKPLIGRYPEGLNKAQRREFVKWNTEWMKACIQKGRAMEQAEKASKARDQEDDEDEGAGAGAGAGDGAKPGPGSGPGAGPGAGAAGAVAI